MRKDGTKYKEINNLPSKAMPVSTFATQKGLAVGYIYVKYERSLLGKAVVDYSIRQFKGVNYVIPD